MRVVIPFILLLAACGKQAAQPSKEAEAPASAVKVATPAKAFVYDEDTDLIEFHYGWSAEAAAIPALAADLRKRLDRVRAEAMDNARQGKSADEGNGFEYRKHSYSSEFETAGQSPRLLSLREDFGAFTGGAHGNSGTRAVLWDRSANKYVTVAALFAAAPNMDRLLTQRWCDALDKARIEKREDSSSENGPFDDCPKLADISIIPADKDKDGQFERLLLVADPYVAGPYVEGSYEIELPVSRDLFAALRSEYRESFEVQPQ